MAEYDYIVVGTGAGGGTVAARLAEYGASVLVLEAGGDPRRLEGGDSVSSSNRLPEDYDVPTFHPFASENNAIKWDFFVRHYADDEQQKRDPKLSYYPDGQIKGVLYPRSSCLGGCTSHNAMITVSPNISDWDEMAELTGDDSWSADNMRSYWEKLENCEHRPLQRFLNNFGINPSRHGYSGWLTTEKALPVEALLGDEELIQALKLSLLAAEVTLPSPLQRLWWQIRSLGDPNDWRLIRRNAIGVHYTPLATRDHARNGTRERLLEAQKTVEQDPSRFGQLEIRCDALATRVLFDEQDPTKAIGVEYLPGGKLYQAAYDPQQPSAEPVQVMAKKEVILAGGAFNTPQLLMLSGIGDPLELEKHSIPVRVNLPGVGKNLQDRYEVGVTNRMREDWNVLKDAQFNTQDPQYQQWKDERKGVYTTNGAVLAAIKRSLPEREVPDLFIFALLSKFAGYEPGYSRAIVENHDFLTWAVLKAHTVNRGGTVTLRSADPTQSPEINFHYFEEGTDQQQKDLQSVVEGIKYVRKLTKPLKEKGLIIEEQLPGESVQTDEELAQFVRDHAWGHHASCTCAIGTDSDPNAVLDGDFRVRGAKNLRVVDASVFPRIPGYFIVSSVYTVAEKAASVIFSNG